MKVINSFATPLGAAALLFPHTLYAQEVYAHYMVSGIDGSTDHAKRDIEDAVSMGLDGFALNVQAPDATWSKDCIEQLFTAAAGTNFKLFFSRKWKPAPSLDLLGGQLGEPRWKQLKEEHDFYFIPSFDDIDGYYDDPEGFFHDWSDIVDGAFNWETAWPRDHSSNNVSSSKDGAFKKAAAAVNKDFMMSMSSLQYKHWSGDHYYRAGEGNLPDRITQILELKPSRVEIISWNDAGESHYFGNIWEESFGTAPEILEYANNNNFPHFAWQPLITSFIQAYKDGLDASQMAPPDNQPIGAMWYRGILKECDSDSPDNADAALDAVTYAFVLPSSMKGATIRTFSGENVISEQSAVGGLNYKVVSGMRTGYQGIEIVHNGEVVAVAGGPTQVVDSDPEFCNFNYHVVALK